MAQIVKKIDLTQSYLPIDPNAFPNTLHYTAKEDTPDEGGPILPYEGYNFLPTSYGYRSYFGTESALTLEALPKPCDQIITFQSETYENMLIAFCSDGIRTAKAGATVWTLALALPDDWTTSQIYRQYTWCVIENNLYIYRQGYAKVIKISDALVLTEFVPSFLNMAGQMGIFRGNGRLCFWDSENSIAWSSAFDLTDFTPSIENMVGNATFLGVLGRIVMVLPHGEGYVIYCTRSIVGVSYSTSGTTVWDAMSITSAGGIAHPGACCIGQSDKEHYAYTSVGIITIGHYNALSRQYDLKPILPELFDFLKESRDPVYVQCHAARFLYISVIDDAYIIGITSFTNVEIPSLDAPIIAIDTSLWDTYGALPYITPNETFQAIDSQLWNSKGVAITDRSLPTYEAPFFSVSMTHPSIPSQAEDMGLLQFGGMYKVQNPTLESLPVPEVVNNAFDSENVIASNKYPSAGTFAILTALIQNMDKTRAPHTFSTIYNCFERSFYKDLYPSKIGNEANSVIDLLYNWMSSVMEYEQFCQDQHDFLIERVNEMNEVSFYDRDVYSSYGNLTITSGQVATKLFFPVGGISVKVDMKDNKVDHISSLYAKASIQKYVTLSTSICARVLKSLTQVNMGEVPIVFAIRMRTYNGSSWIDPTAWAYFDHYPTQDEILAAFDTPEMYQTETATGQKWKLYFDQAETPSGANMASASYTNFCRAVNLTTNAKAWRNFDIRYLRPGHYNADNYSADASVFSYSHLTSLYDTFSDYIAQGYKYLLPNNNWYSGTEITTSELGVASIQFNYMIRTGAANLPYTPHGGSVLYDLSRTLGTSMELLPNGDLAGSAYVRKYNSGEPFTKQVVYIQRAQKVYKYSLEEELIFALVPVDRNSFSENATMGGTDFIFNASQQGVNTINQDMFGRIFPTLKTTYFTPNVVDPGEGQPLASVPANEAYFATTPGPGVTISDCIPWQLKNIAAGGTQVVHGQHFMSHSIGQMLGINQPLGEILTIEDSGNSCYPDLDADGWVYSDPTFTYPPATFTLQDGVPVPAYPTLVGSFVMDMHLKKWGKQAGEFSCLLQFSPINATNNEAIPYTNFGMDSGILSPFDKKIKLFAQNDNNSVMRYGKIGLYRLGFTEVLEVNINFRTPYTGDIIVDGSINSRDLDLNIQHKESFAGVTQALVKCHVNAMWHTISISGNFDLQYMEFRGIMAARR